MKKYLPYILMAIFLITTVSLAHRSGCPYLEPLGCGGGEIAGVHTFTDDFYIKNDGDDAILFLQSTSAGIGVAGYRFIANNSGGDFLLYNEGTFPGPEPGNAMHIDAPTGDITLGSTDNVIISSELSISGVAGSGKVICVKADGNLGVCSDDNGDGTCTCG